MTDDSLIQKRPFFFDKTKGRVGSFVGTEPSTREGYVKPVYIPLNSFSMKKVTFTDPVPEEAIVRISPPTTSEPGIQNEYVMVTENADGEAALDRKEKERRQENIASLREANREKEVEVKQHKQARQKAEQGAEEMRKQEEESKGGSRNTIRDRMNEREW